MEKDLIFETAERYVKYTGRSIFLTGRAGTGKTTFLKYVAQTISKRYVILAPTGVAAINAGGATIHSFFQLPLSPYLPDIKELITEYQLPDRYRSLSKERIKIIRTLDLLIIDEISMVRADLLDAIDMSLRRYRRNDSPFGGVQLLMIGDIHQLSPVVKEGERKYISQVYPSPYFFHSKALKKLDYVTIELQKVHRQRDAEFIEILNAVRENRLTHDLLRRLNARVGMAQRSDDVIRLTTHNAQSDHINSAELAALPGEATTFKATIDGDFPENIYPVDENLSLKLGAKVMFVRNDSEGRFYNGKIGRITAIADDGGVTVLDLEGNSIEVGPVAWENIQYVIDEETSEIVPSVVGTFKQLPLRVAWAVTIHKSQGLTFDNVIIDAAAAFAFGQVYVALSRCRTLEGISLESPIGVSSLYQDDHVSSFNSCREPFSEVEASLSVEIERHRFEVLREIFGFKGIVKGLGWLMRICAGGVDGLYPTEFAELTKWHAEFERLKSVGESFCRQLSGIEASRMPDDTFLNERLRRASEYFMPSVEEAYEHCCKMLRLEIDNKKDKKRVKEAGEEIVTALDILRLSLKQILDGAFSVEEYSRIKTQCVLEDRSARKHRTSKAAKSHHPTDGDDAQPETLDVNEALRIELQEWRTERYKADNIPAYTIIHQSTLLEIASRIPKTKEELLSIKGFGNAKYEKYGADILSITSRY